MSQFELSGKTALITGSSRGIGKAIAEGMAEAGARVIISSRNQEACDRVAAEINERLGETRAVAIAASISSKQALEHLFAAGREAFGPIDILVCNAASNPHYGSLSAISDEAFRKVFENNVLANHWLAQLAAPDMIKAGGGAIIVISSIGAYWGSKVIGAYNISKGADLQLVRNLALELGEHGIRVNAIAPGVIRTDFAKALYEDPKAEAALKAATPLGRIGEPEDVAGTAIFLAAPASRHISGQCIIIDGGAMAGGMA